MKKRYRYLEKPPRSISEIMNLGDPSLLLSRDRTYAYKQVTREEASDLWAVGKTIMFNVVDTLETWWPHVKLNKYDLENVGFFKACELASLGLPQVRDFSLRYFVRIPIRPK